MGIPLFSIVLPTRNRGEMLERAVVTVLGQENSRWELIVVDDGETNAQRYLPKDERVRYIKNPFQMGAPASRNIGISQSKGVFIAYLDDDDEWYANHLSVPPDDIEELDFLYSSTDIRRGGRVEPWKTRSFSYNKLAQYNFVPAPSVIHRKNILMRSGVWNERLPCLQDWDLWCRIALRTNRISSRMVTTALINWSESGITAETSRKRVRKRVAARIKLKYYLPLILKGTFLARRGYEGLDNNASL